MSKEDNPNDIYAIDTYPVPVCDNIRISRCRIYQGEVCRSKIASKYRYFYGLKAHLMVIETGHIVEVFFTPGRCSDVKGMRCFPFELPPWAIVYADKAYCDYGIEDALKEADITFRPLRKRTQSVSLNLGKFTSNIYIESVLRCKTVLLHNFYQSRFMQLLLLDLS